MMRRLRFMPAAVGIALAGLALGSFVAMAQQADQPGQRQPGAGVRGDRGPGGERGQFDPARMREMMAERLKERLEATDEEWKALQPLVTSVMEKQAAARMGGGGFFGMGGRSGGRGGPGAPGAERGDRGDRGDRGRGGFGQPSPEIEALQKALESKTTPATELQARMKALRDARKKAEQELQAAREQLRAVLTARQEGELLLMGILD